MTPPRINRITSGIVRAMKTPAEVGFRSGDVDHGKRHGDRRHCVAEHGSALPDEEQAERALTEAAGQARVRGWHGREASRK